MKTNKILSLLLVFSCLQSVLATAPREIALTINLHAQGKTALTPYCTTKNTLEKILFMTPHVIVRTIADYTNYKKSDSTVHAKATVNLFIYLIFNEEKSAYNPKSEISTMEKCFFLGRKTLEKTLKNAPETRQILQNYFQNYDVISLGQQVPMKIQVLINNFQAMLGIPLLRNDEEHIVLSWLEDHNDVQKKDFNTITNHLSFVQLIQEISPANEQKNNGLNLTFLKEKIYLFLREEMYEIFNEIPYKNQLKTEIGKYYACLMQLEKESKYKHPLIFFPPHRHLMNHIIIKLCWEQRQVLERVEKKLPLIFFEKNNFVKNMTGLEQAIRPFFTNQTIVQALTNANVPISKAHIITLLNTLQKNLNTKEIQKYNPLISSFTIKKIYTLTRPNFSIYNLLEFIHKGCIDKKKDQENIDFFLDIIFLEIYRKLGQDFPCQKIEQIQHHIIVTMVSQLFKKNLLNKDTVDSITNRLTEIYKTLQNPSLSYCYFCSQEHVAKRVYTNSNCYAGLCCLVKGTICKLCIKSKQKCTFMWESPLKKSSIKYKKESEEPNGCSNALCYFSFCCCLWEKCCPTEHLYKAICKNPLCLTTFLTYYIRNNDKDRCLNQCVQNLDKTDCCSMLCCGKCTLRCCDDICIFSCNPLLQCCNAHTCVECLQQTCFLTTFSCSKKSFLHCCCCSVVAPPNYGLLYGEAFVSYKDNEPIMLTTKEYCEQKKSGMLKGDIKVTMMHNDRKKCYNNCIIL